MSTKLIGRNERGSKVYLGALSPQEIKEADEFLLCLQKDISTFEIELKNACSPSSLEYKYKIGDSAEVTIIRNGKEEKVNMTFTDYSVADDEKKQEENKENQKQEFIQEMPREQNSLRDLFSEIGRASCRERV